jgi:hypothetical protein
MMEQKQEKNEMATEAMKALQEIEEEVRLENIVQNNRIKFSSNNKEFRIRKPNFAEQQEIEKARRKKYLELVNDDSFLFRKQWIEKYKEKNIDIDKMDEEMKKKEAEIKNLLLRLAKTKEPKIIKDLKNQILKLRDEQFLINMEKTDLLSYSIEDQLAMFVNSYTVHLILEKKDGNEWVKYFKTYGDFEKCNDMDLLNRSLYYLNYLIFGESK